MVRGKREAEEREEKAINKAIQRAGTTGVDF